MSTTAWVLIVTIAVLPSVLVVGLAIAFRGRVQQRLYAGTGLTEWNQDAKQLPWSDRVHLYRANSRGQAARPDLAATADRRGRVMAASLERYSTMAVQRWLRIGMIVLGILQIALNGWDILRGDGSWFSRIIVAGWFVVIVVFLVLPWLQRRQLQKVRRSIALNDALDAQHPDQPPDGHQYQHPGQRSDPSPPAT